MRSFTPEEDALYPSRTPAQMRSFTSEEDAFDASALPSDLQTFCELCVLRTHVTANVDALMTFTARPWDRKRDRIRNACHDVQIHLQTAWCRLDSIACDYFPIEANEKTPLNCTWINLGLGNFALARKFSKGAYNAFNPQRYDPHLEALRHYGKRVDSKKRALGGKTVREARAILKDAVTPMAAEVYASLQSDARRLTQLVELLIEQQKEPNSHHRTAAARSDYCKPILKKALKSFALARSKIDVVCRLDRSDRFSGDDPESRFKAAIDAVADLLA